MGTRGSALARWQAQHVRARLAEAGADCEIVVVTTSGDRHGETALAQIGGKGLFTKELEEGLRAGDLDFAVHSLKDVPAQLPPGLVLGAVPERADVRDALVAAPGATLLSLPPGARLGTGSVRRRAQVLGLRHDLILLPLRGNVDTRLRRWREGDFDALLLAGAGLDRLGRAEVIAERLDPEQFLPAAAQGALALECRAGDARVLQALAPLHHAPTARAVAAERALLRRLECGCQAPVAAWAREAEGKLRLDALVASPDGSRRLRHAADGSPGQPEALGEQVAEALLRAGAAAILRQ
ncbi:MAG: hydroxymethylbilane synthase [Terriglobales bacterium]